MAKAHVVKLTIKNNTGYTMSNPSSTFESGRVADGWNIPTTISPGDTAVVEMYERDWALAGCSGYINYTLNNQIVTIAFSNPKIGSNKLGCGVGGQKIQDNMSSHDYNAFTEKFTLNSVMFTANLSCTEGDVNQANVLLTTA
jgi:hypothetical protein